MSTTLTKIYCTNVLFIYQATSLKLRIKEQPNASLPPHGKLWTAVPIHCECIDARFLHEVFTNMHTRVLVFM